MKKNIKVNFSQFLNVEFPEVSFKENKINSEEGFSHAILLIEERCVVNRKKLMFIGNGGSAAIASHQAIDFFNTCKIEAMAFNDPSVLTCLANDFGYEKAFARIMDVFAKEGDILGAISSSGSSKNILNAVEKAKEKGCFIITMSGFNPGNPLRRMGDLNFYARSDSYRRVEAAHLVYWDIIGEYVSQEKNKSRN